WRHAHPLIMRVVVTGLLLISLLAQSCNSRRSDKSLYKQGSYIRISSEADSVRNLYVIYKSIHDTSRTMLKSYWDNGKVQSVGFFFKGERDGPWMQFFDDGYKSFDGYFKQG